MKEVTIQIDEKSEETGNRLISIKKKVSWNEFVLFKNNPKYLLQVAEEELKQWKIDNYYIDNFEESDAYTGIVTENLINGIINEIKKLPR